ncbi:Uncharacterised protein [Candidatus Tiddalikarchaeum anstoanum]|nr:Uncharacterised protein [Candidatus Tiddalikarchaeum anstoanum]
MITPPNNAKYYVKVDVNPQINNVITNASFKLRELKQMINTLNGTRQVKAELRKELYEILISIRLNLDKFKGLMPSHEAELLEKKLREITQYVKKTSFSEKKSEQPFQIKREETTPSERKTKVEIEARKEPNVYDNASESEKQELEMLKQDLEDISKELKKKERIARLRSGK